MGAERHPAPRYPTQARVDWAVAMARRAGINEVGSIEFGPDGAIRVSAARTPDSVEDEIARWKQGRQKG